MGTGEEAVVVGVVVEAFHAFVQVDYGEAEKVFVGGGVEVEVEEDLQVGFEEGGEEEGVGGLQVAEVFEKGFYA